MHVLDFLSWAMMKRAASVSPPSTTTTQQRSPMSSLCDSHSGIKTRHEGTKSPGTESKSVVSPRRCCIDVASSEINQDQPDDLTNLITGQSQV